MSDDNLKALAKEAWEAVIRHPKADLRTYLAMEGVELKGGRKPVVKVCPFCQEKGCAALLPQGDVYIFTCRHTSCPTGGKGMGISKYIQERNGVDWKEARRILFGLTGIEDPFEERRKTARHKTQEKKEEAPGDQSSVISEEESHSTKASTDKEVLTAEGTESTEEEEEETVIDFPTPDSRPLTPESTVKPIDDAEAGRFIRIPATGRTPQEAFWLAMELSPAHRAELKTKRGFTDEWITANGFKTSCKANRAKLEEAMEGFTTAELLKAGLVTKWPGNPKVEIAQQLCGQYWDSEEQKTVNAEIIVIPYVNAKGRITRLRPHKLSLSNKNFREAEGAEMYLKETANLSTVYGEHLMQDRPEEWANTCVLCEGEFKAAALRLCGIPAIAFPGIMFLRQNIEARQAIELVKTILTNNGIREVIVVFDSEDKAGKPFHQRFDAEIYSRYTCLELENLGFRALFGIMPEDWREKGKADWDSRLAFHVLKQKGLEAGIAAAGVEFTKFLHDRKDRKGHKAAVREAPRQVDFLDPKEDVINQALHRLCYTPMIHEGGKRELHLASEIQNQMPQPWFVELRCKALVDALRASVGCYYMAKAPGDKTLVAVNKCLAKIKERLTELEEMGTLDEDEEQELRGLRATRTACYTILYRFPKVFTTFTLESKYKVRVRDADGSESKSRLVVFRDKNGVRSKPCQMPAEAMRSAQEMRKFFLSQGEYHCPTMNQDCCDYLGIHIDQRNYQRTIEEIDTYGWNRQEKFWLLGDCAVIDGGDFLFPDDNGIIWIKGTGYKNSENMAGFTSKPPCLFPDIAKPKDFLAAMDWKQEREECEAIWRDALADYKESFGGYAGYALLAGILQYLSHPEVLREIGGKPSIAIQGEKGSGKTKSVEFAMGMFGYPRDYGYISLGGTKVGVERSLCQYSCIPFHIDEWRNINADEKMHDLMRNCYNETSSPKGTPNGGKAVRNVTPLTTPIITGEDGFIDPALRSRFVRIFASKDVDAVTDAETPDIDIHRRDNRYNRIMDRCGQYHRIGRYLFRHRKEFSEGVIRQAKSFQSNPKVMERITDARARQVFGVFFGTLATAHKLITGTEYEEMSLDDKKDLRDASQWFIDHGSESSEETEADVFRKRIFDECVTMIESGDKDVEKTIRVWPGKMGEDGKIKSLTNIQDTAGRLYVFIAAKELFDFYAVHKRKKGENVPMAKSNVQGELSRQPAWVKPPRQAGQKEFRFVVPGTPGTRTWWVLDYKLLDPELRKTFQHVWERELYERDLHLASDGFTILDQPEDAPDRPLGF